jgi:hypothetical protein
MLSQAGAGKKMSAEAQRLRGKILLQQRIERAAA